MNRRATIVIEHIIQASDVSHTMQHWQIYNVWNRRLFFEMYDAYVGGRAEKDPAESWYEGEIWFFDKETSTMNVRILGIAPLIDVKDDQGNFRYEAPLFWVYYPHAREMFARHRVFTMGGNTNATISWEDLFEMRHFASYIYKESNVYDRKIEEYPLSGVDLLMESEKIKNDIFNYEHDLWQY